MQRKRYQALAALGAAAGGLALTVPYGHTFAGGLLQSGFAAALVGGLADWFAVTALFGKPLGFISWRAELVARNKERILADLTALLEAELLTPEHMRQVLHRYAVVEVLREYWQEHGGRQALEGALGRMLQDLALRLPPEELGRLAEGLLRRGLTQVEAAPLLAQGLRWCLERRYDDAAAAYGVRLLQQVVGSGEFRRLLGEVLEAVLARYEQGGVLRGFVNSLAGVNAPERLDGAVQWLQDLLQQLAAPDHPLRQRLRAWLLVQARRWEEDEDSRRQLEAWKERLLRRQLWLAPAASDWLRQLQLALLRGETAAPQGWAAALAAALEQGLLQPAEARQDLEAWAKRQLEKILARCQGRLGGVVQAYLGGMSGAELAQFVQERVGDDLQMIRINGSLVGGLAGSGLFLLTYALERLVAGL